ncbi:hypothetical protein QQS21_010413 [Conoideocrella luteorostrata]|uniref:Uncharacterized protein n=1 Tax=Conoideocrella luteorostrata TaxID=1105319 RepID=A0AAJ0CHT5_9HYPO|nr:hypothetical protein QQS21_010413 [Conoideocrella luteorostrata]
MCSTDVYTYVYPDGHKETVNRPSLCPSSRHGIPCVNNVVFQHATQHVPYGHPVAPAFVGPASYSSPYYNHMPPTPNYTPRTSTPSYRSGDESDRSYHSSNSARRRRSSVYINGQRLESGRHGRDRERILLVDNPPTPRTPPQAFTFPSTAPSSPSFANNSPFIVDASPRGHPSRRPVIVDERNRNDRDRQRIRVEPLDGHRRDKHARQSSTSSYDSRYSYNSASEDEERRRLRLEAEQRQAEKRRLAQQEEEIRQSKMRAKIAKANAEIASRHPVPVPLKRSSTSFAAKAHAAKEREDELLEAIQKLNIKEKKREERGRVVQRDEEEAQRYRLMQRMVPRRRATVGPGSRRHRVEYDDGVYRWE